MAQIKFIDHTEEIKGLIADLAFSSLEEAAGELETQVKRNHDTLKIVKTGQTKNSWQHRVTGSMMAGEYRASVGSDYKNAIWEEFGTGDYALNGDGRKGGWFYEDAEGVGHFTHGKKPRRPFWKAYSTMKPKLIKFLQDKFKRGLS
jgi:hypothetical protein